jgi:hypothetical protein
MMIDAVLDEEATEFHPGYTVYTIDIFVPQQDTQTVVLKREIVHGTFSSEEKIHPALLKIAINCIKEYIAKIHTQSSY